MKIEVKYNIDFGKALKELEEKKLSETLNKEVTPQTVKSVSYTHLTLPTIYSV